MYWGDDFKIVSVFSAELDRLRIHALRQSTELLKKLTFIPHGGLCEMTSGFVSVLVLSLVRLRIHALRHSTELFEEAHTCPRDGRLGLLYSALSLVQQWIHALRQSAAWDFHGVSL